MIRSIEQFEIAQKRLFIRVDFNVPLDKKTRQVKDDARIRAALPTIKYAIAKKARVILASHLGRPDGKVAPEMSLEPAGARLSQLLGQDVIFADDCVGDGVKKLVGELREGQVLLLENLRFHPEEEANDDAFARELAALCDVYVDDAFGTVHRAHASTVGMVKHVPQRGAGFLVAAELKHLQPLLKGAAKPYLAILGGAKVSDKIKVIDQLMGKVDALLIGGAMAYTFLSARGVPVGASRVEKDKIDVARRILERAGQSRVEVLLPSDHVVANEPKAGVATRTVTQIPEGMLGLDIGPMAREQYRQRIIGARTVFWNGPMGMFEIPEFAPGTRAVAEALAEATKRGARTVVGGGDSAAANQALKGSAIQLFAQNCHYEKQGAFTGEVSAPMLAEIGCDGVILGHSERRQYFGETDETVNRKLRAALEAKLHPIVCVGETLQERDSNRTWEVVSRQVRGVFVGLEADAIGRCTVAYEPVWAIGTGKTATTAQAQEVHGQIRGLLRELAGFEISAAVRIQYGGSCKPENAADLLGRPDIDGALVGGASLKAEDFARIIAAA